MASDLLAVLLEESLIQDVATVDFRIMRTIHAIVMEGIHQVQDAGKWTLLTVCLGIQPFPNAALKLVLSLG